MVNCLNSVPVAWPPAAPDTPCLQAGRQLLAQIVTAFHGVGTVGRRRQAVVEKEELLLEPLHVGVLTFTDVQHQAPGPVERLQVALDAGKLVRLLSGVGADVYLKAPLFPFCRKMGRNTCS